MLFGVQIPPARLALAIVCTALALVLLLVVLIRGIYHRVRFGRRYGDPRGFRRKKGRAVDSGGIFPHHCRPSSSGRRYGKGYRPTMSHKKRRRVHRKKYGQFQYHGYNAPVEVGNRSPHDD